MKTSLSEIEGQDTKLINLNAYKFIVSHGFSQMKMGNKMARNGRAFSHQRHTTRLRRRIANPCPQKKNKWIFRLGFAHDCLRRRVGTRYSPVWLNFHTLRFDVAVECYISKFFDRGLDVKLETFRKSGSESPQKAENNCMNVNMQLMLLEEKEAVILLNSEDGIMLYAKKKQYLFFYRKFYFSSVRCNTNLVPKFVDT